MWECGRGGSGWRLGESALSFSISLDNSAGDSLVWAANYFLRFPLLERRVLECFLVVAVLFPLDDVLGLVGLDLLLPVRPCVGGLFRRPSPFGLLFRLVGFGAGASVGGWRFLEGFLFRLEAEASLLSTMPLTAVSSVGLSLGLEGTLFLIASEIAVMDALAAASSISAVTSAAADFLD